MVYKYVSLTFTFSDNKTFSLQLTVMFDAGHAVSSKCTQQVGSSECIERAGDQVMFADVWAFS